MQLLRGSCLPWECASQRGWTQLVWLTPWISYIWLSCHVGTLLKIKVYKSSKILTKRQLENKTVAHFSRCCPLSTPVSDCQGHFLLTHRIIIKVGRSHCWCRRLELGDRSSCNYLYRCLQTALPGWPKVFCIWAEFSLSFRQLRCHPHEHNFSNSVHSCEVAAVPVLACFCLAPQIGVAALVIVGDLCHSMWFLPVVVLVSLLLPDAAVW